MNIRPVVLAAVLLVPAICQQAQAVEVYEGNMGSPDVVVNVTAPEAQAVMTNPFVATRLAGETAWRIFGIVGIPQSVTGKVAALPVFATLVAKYSWDIGTTAQRSGGQGFLLQYPVDINRLRYLWEQSAKVDWIMPGSPGEKILLHIVNELINSQAR